MQVLALRVTHGYKMPCYAQYLRHFTYLIYGVTICRILIVSAFTYIVLITKNICTSNIGRKLESTSIMYTFLTLKRLTRFVYLRVCYVNAYHIVISLYFCSYKTFNFCNTTACEDNRFILVSTNDFCKLITN